MGSLPTLTFLGAAGTVTGSKYLLQVAGTRVLVDCGLFQGRRPLRQRNRQPLPLDAASLDAVVLTHAHLDHSGYLPVLRQCGFTGPVYCTSGTAALARILLPDSGYLQEEDARYANRKGFSKHQPATPLYTRAEAEACLEALHPVGFGEPVRLGGNLTATFHPGGHILGAAWIQLETAGRRITFSGDLGRPNDPVMNPPQALQNTDYLIVESTYDDRRHARQAPLQALRGIINQTVRRNGVLLIPSFAVGRAQTLLHLLASLRSTDAIPDVPVYLNSPMAINATNIFCDHADEHRLSPEECKEMCGVAEYVNTADDSRALNRRTGPMIVLSASGMATGGRILHHLKSWLDDARNTVLFTGYQAAGTRGAAMVAGAEQVKIHGDTYRVAADITELTSLSAHADVDELIDWMMPLDNQPPTAVFITHGEPTAASALRDRIGKDFGINAVIPKDRHTRVLQ